MSKRVGIVTAAGLGTRFGGDKNEIELEGIPVVVWACRAIQPWVDALWVTAAVDRCDQMRRVLKRFDVEATVIEGGQTRTASVKRAFEVCTLGMDQVLIHDGARPLLSAELVQRLLEKGHTESAVIPVLPVVDTLKEVADGYVRQTVPRQQLVHVQTPQLFACSVLRQAYLDHPTLEVTDESQLIEKQGIQVAVVPGEARNLKVTFPDDITRLSYFLRV